ncbi:MAG: hypothetical protein HQ559_07310 [Lentisphaerae bacterium]|nr:hypothetical protein [Lentisphaerota bacterium]
MELLRTDYSGRGKWRKIADALNAIGILFNTLTGENGVELRRAGRKLIIAGPPLTRVRDVSAWRYQMVSPNQVTIGPGAIVVPGRGAWETAETVVPLTSSPAFVFVTQDRVDLSAVAVHPTTLTSYPETESGEYRFALFEFTSSDGGVTYTVARDCRLDRWMGTPP